MLSINWRRYQPPSLRPHSSRLPFFNNFPLNTNCNIWLEKKKIRTKNSAPFKLKITVQHPLVLKINLSILLKLISIEGHPTCKFSLLEFLSRNGKILFFGLQKITQNLTLTFISDCGSLKNKKKKRKWKKIVTKIGQFDFFFLFWIFLDFVNFLKNFHYEVWDKE